MTLTRKEVRPFNKLNERTAMTLVIIDTQITENDVLRHTLTQDLGYSVKEAFRLGVNIGRARTRQRLPIARRRGAMWAQR